MKYTNWLSGGQLLLAGGTLLAAVSAGSVDQRFVIVAAIAVGISLFLLAASHRAWAHRILGMLFDGYVRSRLCITLLLGAWLGMFLIAMFTPISRLPPLLITFPFLLLYPWLVAASLVTGYERHHAAGLVSFLFKVNLSLLVFVGSLELLGQLLFNNLPPSLRYRMPQMAIRSGITDQTAGGWREFPAHETARFTIDGRTGDLYAFTCVARPIAPLFEPYTVTFTRDDHGFRRPASGSERVDMVVVGDSFTAGEAVQSPFWENITPGVLNLGLPDSGSLEQLTLLQAFGLPRKPRIVVMAFFGGNDLFDTWAFQQARLSGQSLSARTMQAASPAEFMVSLRFLVWLASQGQADSCDYPITDSRGNRLVFYDPFFVGGTFGVPQLQNSKLYGLTRDAIVQAAEETRAGGATFVLMFVPYKAQAHWNLLGDGQMAALARHIPVVNGTSYGLPAESGNMMQRLKAGIFAQRDLLAQLARESGFLFLDLTPVFQAATESGGSYYFYGDTHWNQAGHDLARKALSDFLAQHGLLKVPAAPS